jgi:hypothetical protein
VVIQITLSVLHRILTAQYRSDKFFGSGFAIASRNSNDGDVQLAAVVPRQVLQSLEHILDYYAFIVCAQSRIVHYGIIGPFFQGCQGVLIAIKIVATQSKKQAPGLNFARISRDFAGTKKQLIKT